MVLAVKLMVPPAHTALLLPAVGADGIGLTVTDIPVLVARSQGVTPDVNTTVTTNGLVPYGVKGIDEFVGIVKVFRELLDPTFSPLTCH